MKKNRVDLARGWVLKAESDLADAKRTIESEGPYDTACFHCQQATEKYLKACLSWHERETPRTHDIEELLLVSVELEPSLRELNLPAEELSAYAVEMRYDAEFWPDCDTAKKALHHVEQLCHALKRILPSELWKRD